jgi:acetolactate synthase-1/2/3 large subunit
VYVGGGCRRSPEDVDAIRSLAETLDAPVFSTFKGKGVYPEDDGRFVGVTASFLPAGGKRVLERADCVAAFGVDFDGLATAHWTLPMGESLIHVNIDPGEIDRPDYEADVAIVDDAVKAAAKLGDEVDVDRTRSWNGREIAQEVRNEYLDNLHHKGLLKDTDPARTPAVLRRIREVLPDETVVTTDVGGFRLWALELFETNHPTQFITAGSWAGMGVGLPAAMGAALAHSSLPVVSFTGDGGLLMCLQELQTLRENDLNVTVVVFNNGDYGTISKSPEIRDFGEGSRFAWNSPNFESIAHGFNIPAETVSKPSEAADAVQEATRQTGPSLVDVDIDPDEPSEKDGADYEPSFELEGT